MMGYGKGFLTFAALLLAATTLLTASPALAFCGGPYSAPCQGREWNDLNQVEKQYQNPEREARENWDRRERERHWRLEEGDRREIIEQLERLNRAQRDRE